MKIPKTLPCASHVYTIKYAKNLIRDDCARGQILFNNYEIIIDDGLEGSILDTCFWHELIHVVDRHYNNDKLDEDTTQGLAEGLAQAFNDMGIKFER